VNNISEIHWQSERRTLWIAYILYVLFFTAPAGFIISLIKTRGFKDVAEIRGIGQVEGNTTLLSHHTWLARTFVVTAALSMMGLGTLYYGVGYVLFTFAAVWWIYRLARGVVALIGAKPMPVWS
jgi:uncharacterized membrane protein